MNKIEKLTKKFKELNTLTDTCFANTKNELDNCAKNCEGHGCPLHEDYAKIQTKISIGFAIEELKDVYKNARGYAVNPLHQAHILRKIDDLKNML